MLGLTLPADIWFYIADNYLQKQDYLNLVQTTRDTRACLLPLVFRTIRFNGWHIFPTDTRARIQGGVTPKQYLGYLQSTQERITGLQTSGSHLLGCIKSVEIWNWAFIPPNLLQAPSSSFSGTISSQVLNFWFLTYKKIIEFAINLPVVRTLTFHECQYGRSATGDVLPFGYTTILPSNNTLGGEDTTCEWLHYSFESSLLSSFLIPGQLNYQCNTDMRISLRKKYLRDILEACPLPLIELRHTVATLFSVDACNWTTTFRHPEKLTGIALTTDHTWDYFESDDLYSLFATCSNLISLELPISLRAFSDDRLPAMFLPNLKIICAPTKIASQIIPGRPLHTIRLRESRDMYSNLDFIQESSTRVKFLDIVGLSFLSSSILTAFRVAPDLEVLLLQCWGKSLVSPHKLIYDTLTELISLRNLRIFGSIKSSVNKNVFPTESRPLSFFMKKKYHPSLEVMYFGPEVKLVWQPGLGWINVFSNNGGVMTG